MRNSKSSHPSLEQPFQKLGGIYNIDEKIFLVTARRGRRSSTTVNDCSFAAAAEISNAAGTPVDQQESPIRRNLQRHAVKVLADRGSARHCKNIMTLLREMDDRRAATRTACSGD